MLAREARSREQETIMNAISLPEVSSACSLLPRSSTILLSVIPLLDILVCHLLAHDALGALPTRADEMHADVTWSATAAAASFLKQAHENNDKKQCSSREHQTLASLLLFDCPLVLVTGSTTPAFSCSSHTRVFSNGICCQKHVCEHFDKKREVEEDRCSTLTS
jgi:hypothetical protein